MGTIIIYDLKRGKNKQGEKERKAERMEERGNQKTRDSTGEKQHHINFIRN